MIYRRLLGMRVFMRVVQTLGRVDKSTSGGMVSDFPKSVPRILGVRIRGFWPPESFRYVLSIPEGFWGSKSADFMYRHSFLLCTISEGFWGSKSADSGCYPSKSLKLRILPFSWMKVATTAFTFKTLLRHYAKWVLTPRSLNVKLGLRRNYHKGRAAIRHYANQTTLPLW